MGQKVKLGKKRSDAQCLGLLSRFRSGEKMREMAKDLGVSKSRVGQLVSRGELLEAQAASGNPLFLLSARTRNCLRAEGLESVAQVKTRVSAGGLGAIPGMGKKSVAELDSWIALFDGQEEDQQTTKSASTCQK